MTDTEPENLLQKASDDVTHMLEAKRLLRATGVFLAFSIERSMAQLPPGSYDNDPRQELLARVRAWIGAELARSP